MELTSIDVRFSVDALYRRSGVPAIPPDEEGPRDTSG
jgi:hypothetical protein